MQMFIWDNYESNEITDNIRYWVDLWEDLIEHFTERLYGLSLENPRLLIRDIIDEIEFNDFKNSENRKYFQAMSDEILKSDPAIQNILKTEWALLRREFGSQRWIYLKQVGRSLLIKFEDGTYFKETCRILKNILLSSKTDKQMIRLLSQNLIVEFLNKEYSLKTIKDFTANIFDKYVIREDGHLITKFPHTYDWHTFMKNEVFDEKEFNQAVSAEIDRASVPDRIDKLEYYFFKKAEDNYFIFEVGGIKGEVDFNIGDVNFYSPTVKRYLKAHTEIDEELFHNKTAEQKFINAAVRLPMVDPAGARRHAEEKINKALDLLRVSYDTKASFEIMPGYLIVDDHGKNIGGSWGWKKSSGSRWWTSLDLKKDIVDRSEFEKQDFLFKPMEQQSDTERKLARSLRWFRKGEETDNSEDKIVSYWVVLENLLRFKEPLLCKDENVYLLAKEIVAAHQGMRFMYDIGWGLYWHVRTLINSSHGNRKCLVLPQEIIDKCNLDPQGPTVIYLKPFIDHLEDMAKSVDRAIIREKIEDTMGFYADTTFAKKLIENYLKEIKKDVLLLYRYRNKIVHNAHYDNTILPYYVEKIRRYAGDLLLTVIGRYSENRAMSIEEIVLEKYWEMNNTIEKLTKGMSANFFEVERP